MVASSAVCAEEYRGSWEQQMACTPDVWRLCSDRIPDVNGIVACLQQNTPQLSDGCRAVFAANNQAAPDPHGGLARHRARRPAPPVNVVPPRYRDEDEY